MNEQNSELSQLIAGLKHTERLFFRKNISKNAKARKPLHLQLFDLIEKTPEAPDSELLDDLKLKSRPQFSILKKHLLTEILNSLTFLYRNENANAYSDTTTLNIKILIDRKLYYTAGKLLSAEKKDCIEKQLIFKLLVLLKLEYRLIQFSTQKNIRKKLDEQSGIIKSAAEAICEYEFLSDQFRKIINLRNHTNSRIIDQEIEESKFVLKSLEKQHPTKQIPINHIIFETAKAILFYMTHNLKDCNTCCKKIIQLWQKQPSIVTSYPGIFRESANICFYNDFSENQLSNFLVSISVFDELAQNLSSEFDKKHWVVIKAHNLIKYFHKSGNYNELRAFLAKEEKEISKNVMEVVPSNEGIATITSIAISFFTLENFKKADEYLYTIKEMNKTIGRTDIHYFGLLFHLLIMFELNDWYRLHNAAEAAYQQVHKAKDVRPFEKELILFLGKLPKIRISGNLHDQITVFLKKLEDYKTDPVKKKYFLYFNYYGWLESKRDGIKYTNYVQQQLRKTAI